MHYLRYTWLIQKEGEEQFSFQIETSEYVHTIFQYRFSNNSHVLVLSQKLVAKPDQLIRPSFPLRLIS